MITINYKFNIEKQSPMFNPLEARVYYVSSCANSLGARVPHVSYVNLLMARSLYVSFINHLGGSESIVSRNNYHYITFWWLEYRMSQVLTLWVLDYHMSRVSHISSINRLGG